MKGSVGRATHSFRVGHLDLLVERVNGSVAPSPEKLEKVKVSHCKDVSSPLSSSSSSCRPRPYCDADDCCAGRDSAYNTGLGGLDNHHVSIFIH